MGREPGCGGKRGRWVWLGLALAASRGGAAQHGALPPCHPNAPAPAPLGPAAVHTQEEWDAEQHPEGFELSGTLPAAQAEQPAAAAPAEQEPAAAAAAPRGKGKATYTETEEGVLVVSSDDEEEGGAAAAGGLGAQLGLLASKFSVRGPCSFRRGIRLGIHPPAPTDTAPRPGPKRRQGQAQGGGGGRGGRRQAGAAGGAGGGRGGGGRGGSRGGRPSRRLRLRGRR